MAWVAGGGGPFPGIPFVVDRPSQDDDGLITALIVEAQRIMGPAAMPRRYGGQIHGKTTAGISFNFVRKSFQSASEQSVSLGHGSQPLPEIIQKSAPGPAARIHAVRNVRRGFGAPSSSC